MASVIITLTDYKDDDGTEGVEMDLRSSLHEAPAHKQFASAAVIASIAVARLWNSGTFDQVVQKVCPDIVELTQNEEFMAGNLSVIETEIPPPELSLSS